MPGGRTLELAVPVVEDSVEDLGAGDVFAAAFFIAIAKGQHAPEAAALGNAAAALRMGGRGGEAVGRLGEIEERAQEASWRYTRRSSSS